MRVLIAYRSKYGTTAGCARGLGQRIKAETVMADLSSRPWPAAAEFDVVLLGGSIYGGKIQHEVSAFCDRQRDGLLRGKVGLFLCCMYQGEQAQAQLRGAFPDWLAAHAFAAGVFGGELHHSRLTPFDRLLLLGLPRSTQEVSLVDTAAIESMAAAVNALIPVT
jgi:menaquinone-dependent protoporphyrinogen oxidase